MGCYQQHCVLYDPHNHNNSKASTKCKSINLQKTEENHENRDSFTDTNISYSVLLLVSIPPLIPLFSYHCPHLSGSSSNLLNSSLKRRWVRTNDLADLLSVLENNEGWHSADADLLGDIWNVVDVHLDEVGGWVLLGEPGGLLAGLVTCGPGGALATKRRPPGMRGTAARNGYIEAVGTYLTRVGAIALQGPHQVANASMITTSCSLRAALNSALLYAY